jgi:DNA-binding transcriptional LysR family regulator
MNIDFELYKVFFYVATHRSFSAASGKLFLSQSAVSQSIRLLEDKLGCRLFNRSTKQVQLTYEGELLFQHIEKAFHLIKAGERSIAEIHSLDQGEIHIGASDTICKYYLLAYLKQFAGQYPRIKIKITNRTSPVCLDLLHKGLVDIAVVNLPDGKEQKNTAVKKLKLLQDVFVAGQAYQQLQNQKLQLKDLEQYQLLMLEKNTVTRDFFDMLLKQHNVAVTPEIELGSLDLVIELTKIGLGLSFITREFIQNEIASGELFILDIQETIPARWLGIATNETLPLTVAAGRFIDMLAEKKLYI